MFLIYIYIIFIPVLTILLGLLTSKYPKKTRIKIGILYSVLVATIIVISRYYFVK